MIARIIVGDISTFALCILMTACAIAGDRVDASCHETQRQLESTCVTEKEIDDSIGVSLPSTADDGVSTNTRDGVVPPGSKSACRFSEEGMGIFHTAGDVYDESATRKGESLALDKAPKDVWYLVVWRGIREDAQLAVHELTPDASGSGFLAAGNFIRSNSGEIHAYALIWKDYLVRGETGLVSEVLRVNAGFDDGKAFDVFMPAERKKYEFTELGCGVNLLIQDK